MDRVTLDEFELPDWFGKEPGYMIIHPDDWDEIEGEAGGLLHASNITVQQVPLSERGVIYLMRNRLETNHYNPLMRNSWD